MADWDVIVIGAGAAGLMTAIQCGRRGLKVLLLDGREKVGAKILISGGTRCNITNQTVTEKDFESETPRAVRNVLRVFPAERAVEFFRGIGVEMVLEAGGKYFPATHSARTVLSALLGEAESSGVTLAKGRKVVALTKSPSGFEVRGKDFCYTGRNIVLCTGGLSYPDTGSDGSGYGLAKSFGHTLVETSPSLTPLLTNDPEWKALSGITLPVALKLKLPDRKDVVFEGSFLFTHFGFSGPAALNISRYWIRDRKNALLTADFMPGRDESSYRQEAARICRENPNRPVRRLLTGTIPERVAETLIKKTDLRPEMPLNQLKREQREKLLSNLFSCPLNVSGSLGYEKAEVTAGGVDLREVSPDMESKLCPGLFFAGEILDVDGRIGGFNFQWAWSSGTAAAEGVRMKCSSI